MELGNPHPIRVNVKCHFGRTQSSITFSLYLFGTDNGYEPTEMLPETLSVPEGSPTKKKMKDRLDGKNAIQNDIQNDIQNEQPK